MKPKHSKNIYAFLAVLLVPLLMFGSNSQPLVQDKGCNPQADSVYVLVLEKKGRQKYLEEGERIFVKVGYENSKGFLKILNDSMILVQGDSIQISEIDLVASPTPLRTLGVFIVTLPVNFIGIGITFSNPEYAIYSIPIAALGIVGLIRGSNKGKTYPAYRLGYNGQKLERKWHYSIKKQKIELSY